MESLYLGITIAAGGYSAVYVGERVWQHLATATAGLLPFLVPPAPHAITSPWLAALAVPLFLLARRQHYWQRSIRLHDTRQAPIFPHRDPVLGVDWLLQGTRALRQGRLLEHLDGFFRSLGSTFWHLSLGEWILLTNDAEVLKALLSTQFEDWPIGGVRQKTTELTLGPHAIFSVNGKEWQEGRAMIRPTFVRNQIADLDCLDRHVERLLGRIPSDGSTVELQGLLYLFTMDAATDFMLGYSTNTLVDPTDETLGFARAFDHALLTSAIRARKGWAAYLVPDRQFNEAVKTCQRFIDRYVSKALSDDSRAKERPYVFLNELLGSGASAEHIRDQLLAIIIGGRDTSAGTMSALFWTLGRRPDVVRKIRSEIAVLGAAKPTWEDLKGFKYLNMVLKETLRLWPPVVTNMRVAAKDLVLPKGGGSDGQHSLFVPKGTAVRWSLYSLHRRQDYFGEDAEEFRPERWEKLRTTLTVVRVMPFGNIRWEYLPFSGGPRTCIGQQFALTQMSYVVTRILQTFEGVEARDDRPMLQNMSTTTSLTNGCLVSFSHAGS